MYYDYRSYLNQIISLLQSIQSVLIDVKNFLNDYYPYIYGMILLFFLVFIFFRTRRTYKL